MFSIVSPIYNGAEYIESTISQLLNMKPDEIILVEDGSTDLSPEICRRLASENNCIKHIHSDERLGKGEAIKRGIYAASNNLVLLTDIDLPCSTEDMGLLLNMLEISDVCVALRIRDFPLLRRVASFGYGSLALLLFRVNLDFQSGVMCVNRLRTRLIFESLKERGFSWGTEFLVKSVRSGIKVGELTVKYPIHDHSTVKASTVPAMLFSLIRIWSDLK